MLGIAFSFLFLASALPTEPLLRLEAGHHSAAVTGIAVDPTGRWLVTGSTDKTARIWDLQTRALARTLRPPIDRDIGGSVMAVAISADAKLVAVAARPPFVGSSQSLRVYLFDRASGRVLRCLEVANGTVHGLAFSPDGTRVVVATRYTQTLASFDVRSGDQVAERTFTVRSSPHVGLHDVSVHALEVDRSGRIAAALDDGTVGIFDGALVPLSVRRVPGCTKPEAVRFSPDASRLAVGCGDPAALVVVSTKDLALLDRLDVRGAGAQALQLLVWPPKSGLCAAERGGHTLYVFNGNKRTELDAGPASLTALGTASEAVIVAAQSGAWGLAANHTISWVGEGGAPRSIDSVRADPSTLAIEADCGAHRVRFSPRDAVLTRDLPPQKDVSFIAIDPPSYANELDRFPIAAAAFTSAHARDVQLMSDGTLRWIDDRSEATLLELALSSDCARWIAWTPSGEHAGEGDARGFYAWHVNRGASIEAEVLADNARDLLRPDVVRAAVMTREERAHSAFGLSDPILVPQTNVHAGEVTSAAVDPQGRWLVTGSEDRTLFVHNLLADAAPTRVPMPRTSRAAERAYSTMNGGDGRPIAIYDATKPDDTGKVDAVAFAPDGSLFAAGGATYGADGRPRAYLFHPNAPLDAFVAIPAGDPGMRIRALAFSAQGERLAVLSATEYDARVDVCTLSPKPGVECRRAWPPDQRHVRIAGLELDRRDQLWIIDNTELIVLDRELHPLRSWKPPEALSFARLSPDGTILAIGRTSDSRRAQRGGRADGGSTRVDLLSTADFSLVARADDVGIEDGELEHAAWSLDGELLCAGGSWRRRALRTVRCWGDRGRGPAEDFDTGPRKIAGLAGLPTRGRVLFASEDSSFGIWTRGTKAPQRTAGQDRAFLGIAPEDDVAAGDARLFADGTGDTVGFLSGDPAERVSFTVATRTLSTGAPPRAGTWDAPLAELGPFVWARAEPRALRLLSRAIAPDRSWFLFGTACCLRSARADGGERWKNDLPTQPTALTTSGDGRYAIAALRDGSIRWYRASDGKEVLALLLHADRKRWILWTPSGYHDTSIGGDALVAWQVDGGGEHLPSTAPLGVHRELFRPDVISSVLEAGDDRRAAEQADAGAASAEVMAGLKALLPPVVQILSPPEGASISDPRVELEVSLRSPSGRRITQLDVLADGARLARFVPRASADPTSASVQKLAVRIPPRSVRIAAVAHTERSFGEVERNLRFTGATPATSAGGPPTLRLLAIGVAGYRQKELSLVYPAKDARAIAGVFAAQPKQLYAAVDAEVLTDTDATREKILAALARLEKRTAPNDVALLFLSGHGANQLGTGRYFFFPEDAETASYESTMISGEEILLRMSNLGARRMVMLDTCDAGNVLSGAQARSAMSLAATINEMARADNGVVVFTASSRTQPAYERPEWGNGAFTKALLEGLSGRARRAGERDITSLGLLDYASRRVAELTRGYQEPQLVVPSTITSSFVIASPP